MAGAKTLAPLALAIAALAAAAAGPTAAAVTNNESPHANAGAQSAVQANSAQDEEIAVLKAEVSKLTSDVAALQANLAAFHTQFSQHVHTVYPAPTGILTILNCSGYGQPCTSATSLTQITVLTPENSPSVGVTSAPTTPPAH